MNNNFKERQLDDNFCTEYSAIAHKFIQASISFSIIGMKRVCISTFLRYLALQDYAHFVYIDVSALSSRTNDNFFRLLLEKLGNSQKVCGDEDALNLCRNQLLTLLETHKKIVIIINRFYHLKDYINSIFLSNLQSLYDVDRKNIVFITKLEKPLYEMPAEIISENNMELFCKVIYFKPYSLEDMKKYLSICVLDLRSKEELPTVLEYAGGHINLMQLLLKTDSFNNPLEDPFIKLQLQMIYDSCTSSQKRQMQQIVKGKDLSIDEFLYKIGVVKEKEGKKVLFSPLMYQYISSQIPKKLSGKEGMLFYLLKNNKNKVVSKETIFNHLWKNDSGNASDWALNSLIYRLKKSSLYLNSDYNIESFKGIGYKLAKR